MQPGDRLVCALVEPLNVGDQFSEWPLHVTVVPWFRTEIASDILANELQSSLADMTEFEASVYGAAQFGRKKDKTVHLVTKPTPFFDIEKRTRSLLKRHSAWLVDESTRTKRQFRPHVTVQASGGLQPGDSFKVDTLYIIEQQGSHKTVAATIGLDI